MPTAADAARLRAAQAALSRRVRSDLDAFWATLDLKDPAGARDALLRFVPTLTTLYGEAAATVAADWFDEVRAAEQVRGQFVAELADPFPAQYVQERVRFGAQHLWTPTPEQTLVFLHGAVQKYALQPGRDTIVRSTNRDPQASGWRRVTRAGACDFCRMLEGRGGVYKETTVRFASHGECGCAAVPDWDPSAPEVDVAAYTASARTSSMTAAQRERHNAAIRDWVAAH